MVEKVAQITSIVLGPQVWLPVLFLSALFHPGFQSENLLMLVPSILILQVVIPLGYLYLAPKVGLATAWDLPKRGERYLFLSLVILTSIISLYLIKELGDEFLFKLDLLTLGLILITFIITLYWKISLHSVLNAFGAIFINYLYGWNLPFLYLTIPIIFWARLTLKKHTAAQLLAGILVALGFMILGLQFL